jgi:hypothetical protein
MSLSHGIKRIVTDGLVLALDAANPKSYPGTGTTWFDMSGQGNNGTMNSVTHLPLESHGVMQTSGVNTSYISVPINLSASNFTVIAISRYTPGATIKGRIISGSSNNWLLGHHLGTSPDYYALGWVLNSVTTDESENWHMYSGSGDIAGNKYSLYVDETALVTDSTLGTAGPNNFNIGKYVSSEFSQCQVSSLIAYNRVLTAAEINQNFEATRARFGI